MKYKINTGDQKWEGEGANPMEAVVNAFRNQAPKDALGVITEATDENLIPYYVSTERALIKAGYEFRRKKS